MPARGKKEDQRRFVLIATNPTDSDSFLVEEALHRKGVHVRLAHLSDFPSSSTASLQVSAEDAQADRWCLVDQPEPSALPDTIWWRRPGRPVIPPEVHPEDKEFVRQETTRFIVGLWHHLPQGTTYVNSPVHALMADRKPYQLRVARDLGFRIPPTLFTNDPAQIRSAIRSWGGQAAYKPFGSINGLWLDLDRQKFVGLFTSAIEESSLPDDQTLSLTPGIYQPLLPKLFELRVTVFGSTVFAAKIHSQEQERSSVDWRNGQRSLRYETTSIPEALSNLCVAMLRRLGLLVGCFDFIVTPQDEIVFLEVNEGGQFLWLETLTGAPLLDAFSDFLIEPDEAFHWQPPAEPLRIQHVQAAAAEKMAIAAETHLCPEIPGLEPAIPSPSASLEEPDA